MLKRYWVFFCWIWFLVNLVRSENTTEVAQTNETMMMMSTTSELQTTTTKQETTIPIEILEPVQCQVPCSHGFCSRNSSSCICFGKGKDCDEECPPNFWGIGCNLKCSCTANQICNSFNGKCSDKKVDKIFGLSKCEVPCKFGFCHSDNSSHCICFGQGRTCEQECPKDKWGVNCQNSCACQPEQICDNFNGQCRIKEVQIVEQKEGSSWGSIFLWSLIIVGGLFGFIYYKKKTRLRRVSRRSRRNLQNSPSNAGLMLRTQNVNPTEQVQIPIREDHFETSFTIDDPLNVSWDTDNENEVGINRENSKNNLFDPSP